MKHNHAGQIVRITLSNFMCYDNIEINPRNQLNLIIGPNGSGKSTILCAVFLGLGGKLKALARADQLSSYVKSGCDHCTIEIELYEPNGQNVVIKRKILSNSHSEFIINGCVSSQGKVIEIRKRYNLQIDNLCTFLPQEKVQEFAQLNSQQLLFHTQRTIGHGDLVELHEELKRLHSNSVSQENNSNVLENKLENAKQKNRRLEDRVKSLKEKQSLCERLVSLNQKKAWMNYDKAIENKEEIDRDHNLAEKDVVKKRGEIESLEKKLAQLDIKLGGLQTNVKKAKNDEAGKREAMRECADRAEGWLNKLEDLKNDIQIKLAEEVSKQEEMLMYKNNIDKLTNDLKTLDAEMGSEVVLRSKCEEADAELKDIHSKETLLNSKRLDLEEEENTLQQEKRNTLKECEMLKRHRNARLEYLKKYEPDVYKSMEWLEKNRSLFKSRVYMPMLLELDVPNTKMAKYVEARLSHRDLISFTCTNPDDLNLLIQKLRTEQKLKVNAICSDEEDHTQYCSQIPINDLRRYGFHSYVKDLITGPEDIIRFLCRTYRIHCIPVGDESVRANCENIPSNIQHFFSENHSFVAKNSIYSNDKSITVKKLAAPKFFAESSDENRIQMLLKREKELERKIKDKQREIEDVDIKLRKLRESLEEVKRRKREFGTSIEKRKQIEMNLTRAQMKHKSTERTLKDPKEIERETNLQREELKKKYLSSLKELKRINEDLEAARVSRQKSEIEYKVKTFGKKELLKNKEMCLEVLSRKQALLREMRERQRAAEAKCLQLKENAKQLTGNVSKEEKGFKIFLEKFAKLPKTLEKIEEEILETETQAELLGEGNHEILQEYERREKEISELTRALDNLKKDLKKSRSEFDEKLESWLNPIEDLISKINENFGKFFQAMNCAGEVSLLRDEDKRNLDAYGITIRVKFRDGVPMQELGGKFQSGGEKAVSTAIFILSLQELTSVPFRFVDEINQGMDPDNERRILQLLINVTASKSATQYFFITPKLLPNVEWARSVTVHCIHKGAKAIPAAQWDMKTFLGNTSSAEEELG